jgi:TPR repeat protein
MNSKSQGDYEAYLQTYPTGRFAALAKARLKNLSGAPTTAQSPESPAIEQASAAPKEQQSDVLNGQEAYARKDYAQALAWFQKAADHGNTVAQDFVGNIYYFGQGVPRDYAQAMTWYRKAADQGNADAQNAVGNIYYNGQGVPQDYALALNWYRKAADQGQIFAQDQLGSMYNYGTGVTKDYDQAVAWYRKAADQGDAYAQQRLLAIQAPQPAQTPRPAPTQAQIVIVKVANETDYDATVYLDGQEVADVDAGESKDVPAPAGPDHVINACYYGEYQGSLLFGGREKKCLPPHDVAPNGMLLTIYPQ